MISYCSIGLGRITAGVAIALLMLTGPAAHRLNAQGSAATILGTVTDSSGAAIPDAAVKVRNVATDITQSTTSNAQGRFVVPDLGIGDYDVQATKLGFATMVHKGVTVTVGSQNVVDFALAVGQQSQTVTVEGQLSQVEVTNAALGSLIGGQQMSNLPINGRNFESLIMLSPGVQTVNTMAPNARQGRANVFSAAGARPEGFVLLMDDEVIDNFFRRGMGTITGSSLGMEAMAEFQTLTNTYGAQFGGNGAVMNAVSKSGTNQIHGSAYYFIRNSALDARGFFDNYVPPGSTTAPVPAFRRSQPGGSVGGPIKKDKAFFFVNYEGIAQLQGQTRSAVVPDANHRTPAASLLASNPTTYNAIVSTLAIYPLPTYNLNPAAGTGFATVLGNNIAHENYILTRMDYTLNTKDSVFLRYFYDKQHVIDPYSGGNGSAAAGFLPYWPERDEGMNHFANLEWRRIISPSLLNTARVSFSRPNTGDYAVNSFPALQSVFPGAGRPDADVGITGLTTLGQSFFVPAVDIQNRFTEADDIVWTRGAHTLHLGASVQRVDSNVFYPFRSGSVWSFTGGLAQFLTGTAGANGVTGTPTSQAVCMTLIGVNCYTNRDYRETDFTPYIQDDWKVSSRLTLNLGLRYEYATNAHEIHNALYTVTNYLTNTTLVNVPNANATNPNNKNWDPRFGFAYDVFADHKTALRGGFAITHSPIFVAQYNPQYTAVTPWPGFVQNNPVYPNINFNSVSNSISPGFDYFINKAPYLIQYNLNVQRELMPGTVLTVGYVGSHGVDMLTEQERNPPSYTIDAAGVYHFATVPSSGANAGKIVLNPRINSKFSTLLMATTGTTSRYDSLQASINRRMNRNVQFQVAYTFSKCIDDGSSPLGSISGGNTSSLYENPYNRANDRGLCYFNAKSTLRINSVVSLPFRGNAFVEGWQLSGIVTQNTGLPFSPYAGSDIVGYAGSGNPRPNVVPGCQVNVGAVTRWFNPACYSVPAPGTLGNAGRDTIIGPGLAQVDFAVFKDTKVSKISESFRVQFRAEFFNLFNHPQFGQPGNAMWSSYTISPVTGLVTSAVPNASAGVISTLAGNTASRQLQFGLKFIF